MADTEAKKWVIYYDGECGFCTLCVRALKPCDFFRRVAWLPYQDLHGPPGGLTWDDLDRAAYLEVRKGGAAGREGDSATRLYRGFYAFRMLTLRLPPLFPLAIVAWLPGVDRLGERAYAWVAANRYRISRRCRLKAGP
ncbi:MAG: DUF393 domain-containing protein [Chloroflexota bacterium]|nr:DUF393 domain-containing protein [Chloroflexota bacterium]